MANAVKNGTFGDPTQYSQDSKSEFKRCGNEKNLRKVCGLGSSIAGGIKQFVNFVVDKFMGKEERKILRKSFRNSILLLLKILRNFDLVY